MSFEIIRNDITKVRADAIVNTANPAVAVGAGVDKCIYEAAGWDSLLAARAKIGRMKRGQAAYTPAFGLDATYIIHTIGPVWRGGHSGERETVANCYRNSLAIADELGCESVAFPLIATGSYGFPKDEALRIAVREISSFILDHEIDVILVVYDEESFQVSGKLFNDIRAFIEEKDVVPFPYTYGSVESSAINTESKGYKRRRRELLAEEERRAFGITGSSYVEHLLNAETSEEAEEKVFSVSKKQTLDDRLAHLDKTFQEYLFMLIDRRGLKDPEVYKKANIDRKLFSKIRGNVNYTPKKKTVLALALALELSLDETKDLLGRAGLALSPSNISDTIIEYCINNKEYNIYEINCILFDYGQDILGG